MLSALPLFLLGLAAGSFINVVALRYKAGGKLVTPDIAAGRSRCPYCRTELHWYELVPLLSFFIQLGRCRHCHRKISWQYPIVEFVSGLIFVFVPVYFHPAPIWVLAALTLLLITLIDLRLSVIPDQLNLFIALLGLALVIAMGNYGAWSEHLIGAGAAAAIFGLIIILSRGQGMGVGDLKLGAALGFLFGWPEIALIIMAAFALGGIWAGFLLLAGKKTLKEAIPFGPFIALAAILVLFLGNYILDKYYPILIF